MEIYYFLKKICNQKADSYIPTLKTVSNQIITSLGQNIRQTTDNYMIPQKMDLSYYLISQKFFMNKYISDFIDQSKFDLYLL